MCAYAGRVQELRKENLVDATFLPPYLFQPSFTWSCWWTEFAPRGGCAWCTSSLAPSIPCFLTRLCLKVIFRVGYDYCFLVQHFPRALTLLHDFFPESPVLAAKHCFSFSIFPLAHWERYIQLLHACLDNYFPGPFLAAKKQLKWGSIVEYNTSMPMNGIIAQGEGVMDAQHPAFPTYLVLDLLISFNRPPGTFAFRSAAFSSPIWVFSKYSGSCLSWYFSGRLGGNIWWGKRIHADERSLSGVIAQGEGVMDAQLPAFPTCHVSDLCTCFLWPTAWILAFRSTFLAHWIFSKYSLDISNSWWGESFIHADERNQCPRGSVIDAQLPTCLVSDLFPWSDRLESLLFLQHFPRPYIWAPFFWKKRASAPLQLNQPHSHVKLIIVFFAV